MRDETGDKRVGEKQRQDLKERTKCFALRLVRLYSSLPKTTEAQVLGKQFLRSGTSFGAHYREAKRAKSDADFINKMEGTLQELDETALIPHPSSFTVASNSPSLTRTVSSVPSCTWVRRFTTGPSFSRTMA